MHERALRRSVAVERESDRSERTRANLRVERASRQIAESVGAGLVAMEADEPFAIREHAAGAAVAERDEARAECALDRTVALVAQRGYDERPSGVDRVRL